MNTMVIQTSQKEDLRDDCCGTCVTLALYAKHDFLSCLTYESVPDILKPLYPINLQLEFS